MLFVLYIITSGLGWGYGRSGKFPCHRPLCTTVNKMVLSPPPPPTFFFHITLEPLELSIQQTEFLQYSLNTLKFLKRSIRSAGKILPFCMFFFSPSKSWLCHCNANHICTKLASSAGTFFCLISFKIKNKSTLHIVGWLH